MNVKAQLSVPDETELTVTIKGTVAEFLALKEEAEQERKPRYRTHAYRLLSAIQLAASRARREITEDTEEGEREALPA